MDGTGYNSNHFMWNRILDLFYICVFCKIEKIRSWNAKTQGIDK